MRNRKKNNKIIIFLGCLLFLMSVGYAAFQSNLDIKGTTDISSNWNIRIISADVLNTNGSAENVKNTYTDLTANLEANLYKKGDYVEYKIMVENSGTFDAKLDTLGITNSNNEAVKITNSGFTKGQTLYKNTTAELIVKIEYNSNYSGDASETSGESNITLGFVQAEGGTIVPTTDHLVTYDYTTNGGESTTAENEYIAEGESINLSYTASRTNYEFLGWSQSPTGTTPLESLTMGTEDIVLYALFKAIDTTPPVIDNVSTTSTTNSITVVVTAHDDESNISKYEYSKDGGTTWVESTKNTYTFNSLTSGTAYDIGVRVTNGVGLQTEKVLGDGQTTSDLTLLAVTSGDGIYADSVTSGRYFYRGTTVNNYITFNDELWRIISVEADGSLKIIKNEQLSSTQQWDAKGTRDSSTSTYCTYASSYGCSSWAATMNLVGTPSAFTQHYPNGNTTSDSTTYSGTVTQDASLNTYLNGTYYNSLTSTAQKQIVTGTFNVSTPGHYTDTETLEVDAEQEKQYSWQGKIALMTVTELLRASTDSGCTSLSTGYNSEKSSVCKNSNWLWPTLNTSSYEWTVSSCVNSRRTYVWYVDFNGFVRSYHAISSHGVRPVVHLSSDITLDGSGTSADPYTITEAPKTKTLSKPTFTQSSNVVTITYPEGCGSTLTCSYIKDGGKEVTVTTQTKDVSFTTNGTLVAKVSDGTNAISASYVYEVPAIIKNWTYSSTTDFHSNDYKTSIITATFLDNKTVPDNAVESWDVSANGDGSVMAWVIADESDSTKHHLYIGGKGGVVANKNSSYLFYKFTNLNSIDFGDNFDTSNVTNMYYMFNGCSSLTSLDVTNFDTSSVTNMGAMFNSCSSLTSLDVTNFDTSKVSDMGSMFNGCSSLTSLDVTNFDTNNVTNMGSMFKGCSSLTSLDVTNFATNNVTNMGSMFKGCSSLTSLDVTNFDTSNVTYMNGMFDGCSGLTSLDVTNFDTNNVTTMSAMFNGCSSLTSLDVTNFDTSSVTNMSSMFWDCSSLTSLDVSNFDTNKVRDMRYMFYGCKSLTSLDLSNFDTSSVTNMYYMFNGCSSLTSLDVTNFDTSKVSDMGAMFYGCSGLTKLNLCSFNTTNVTNMEYMFRGTSNLTKIYAGSNWTTANATTTNMFYRSGVSAVTQSDTCVYDADEMTLSLATSSTTKSITVVATAYANSGIVKYEYSKDGGTTWVESNDNTYTFNDLTSGTAYDIAVRVTSKAGSTLEAKSLKSVDIIENTVTSGDGLYADSVTSGRYFYRGATVNNYITFNNELWRILSVEADGTLKIIRNEQLSSAIEWDALGTRDSSTSTYCAYASEYGCNAWATTTNLVGTPSEFTQHYPKGNSTSDSTTYSGTVTQDASLNTYLNGTYYNSLTTTAKNQMVAGTFNVSTPGNTNDTETLEVDAQQEKQYRWQGKIALMTVTELLRASTNSGCTSLSAGYNSGSSSVCKNSNWLWPTFNANRHEWTVSPDVYSDRATVWLVDLNGYVGGDLTYSALVVRPVLHLSSSITLSGSGTSTNPYTITEAPKTQVLSKPTFTQSSNVVTITYPEGCGSTLTCSYIKDSGTETSVTSTSKAITFTADGTLVAKVTDGTNTVSSSYTYRTAASMLKANKVTSGDGIYADTVTEGRYFYRGATVNNYITFNDETWRIISVEADGTLKIIRNEQLSSTLEWDPKGARDSSTSTYCKNASFWGCNAWAATMNLVGAPSEFTQHYPKGNSTSDSTTYSGTVTQDASLNTYLNGEYYNSLTTTAQKQIVTGTFNVSTPGTDSDTETLEVDAQQEKQYQWQGKVALMTVTELLRASTDSGCWSLRTGYNSKSSSVCKNSNWLWPTFNAKSHEWTVSPNVGQERASIWRVHSGGYVNDCAGASDLPGVRPVVHLSSYITLGGSGTSSNPYKIN